MYNRGRRVSGSNITQLSLTLIKLSSESTGLLESLGRDWRRSEHSSVYYCMPRSHQNLPDDDRTRPCISNLHYALGGTGDVELQTGAFGLSYDLYTASKNPINVK